MANTRSINMNTYYISEAMLGDEATEQDARRMVQLLRERGYDVEYGNDLNRGDAPFTDAEWQVCLDFISSTSAE
jgi:hypothetical protein